MPTESLLLLLLVSLPFVGGAVALFAPYRSGAVARWIAMAFNIAAIVVLGLLTADWKDLAPPQLRVAWVPQFGLDFHIWLDGVALFWAWLVLGIGFLVLQYAGHYMDPKDNPRRFYAVMIFFIGAMLGVVISANLLLMAVFWEITSLTSFLLIGHWSHKKDAVLGAKRALVVTALGGLFLLAGVAMVYYILSQTEAGPALGWAQLFERADEITEHPLAPWALVLLLIGAFTKSAQFPFHFWLPGAMEAPTPVSALLHAATMVKAGIYLLGRLFPIFGVLDMWILVAVIGVITMLTGGFLALLSYDLKQLLAFSTVSQLGLLTSYYGFGFGRLDGDHLLELDLLLVLSHALFKAALFMVCGIIDHSAHTRDWRRLGGLWKKMPVTFVLSVIGCASMAGLPFTLGFVAKKFYSHGAHYVQTPLPWLDSLLYGATILGGMLTMGYCLRFVVLTFFGKPRDEKVVGHAHEGGPGILAAPVLQLAFVLASGIVVTLAAGPVGALVYEPVFETVSEYKTGFFKAFDSSTVISLLTFLVGGPLAFIGALKLVEPLWQKAGSPQPFRTAADWLSGDGLIAACVWVRKAVQAPSLSRNTLITLLFVIAVCAWPLLTDPGRLPVPRDAFRLHPFGITLAIIVAVCCLMLIVARETIYRLLLLGLIGLSLTGYFTIYKAPDLAITLVLVELALLFMYLYMLRHVGDFDMPKSTVMMGWTKALVSVAGGLLVAGLTWFASVSPDRSLPVYPDNPTHKEFYLAYTKYPPVPDVHSGGGFNAVNVILVDFRVFDTLGEIIVLALAAMGVAILISGGRRPEQDPPLSETLQKPTIGLEHALAPGLDPFMKARLETVPALVLRTTAGIVSLLAFAFAGVLFFSGHNSPGGGFIGGLLGAAAVFPFLVAWRRGEQYPIRIKDPVSLFGIGMLIALIAGLVPVLLGLPYFRSGFTYVDIPLIGEVEVASAVVFDAGVFLLVVGITITMLRLFGRKEIKWT